MRTATRTLVLTPDLNLVVHVTPGKNRVQLIIGADINNSNDLGLVWGGTAEPNNALLLSTIRSPLVLNRATMGDSIDDPFTLLMGAAVNAVIIETCLVEG